VGLFERWCESTKEENKRKHYWTYVEKDGGRDEIRDDLAQTIRSHYDQLERIAEDVKRLGYEVAGEILSAAMPQTPKGRSGDLGEILATELVEEEIGLRVPVPVPIWMGIMNGSDVVLMTASFSLPAGCNRVWAVPFWRTTPRCPSFRSGLTKTRSWRKTSSLRKSWRSRQSKPMNDSGFSSMDSHIDGAVR